MTCGSPSTLPRPTQVLVLSLLLLPLLIAVSVTGRDVNYVDDKDDVTPTIDSPIVTTKYGQVQGSRKISNRKTYDEFLGIPFAAPPVGDLRWKKPQLVEPWDDVLNTTVYSPSCTQLLATLYPLIGYSRESGEDCLYLNVWVPRGVDGNQGRPLPVMVFIYGGGFQFGTGEMYPGPGLALQGDLVVVNFNYRVSSLGWLSTGDEAAPGNYGMWDMESALVWVQENIAQFGGDPSRVAISGQSAGGSLVSYAVISPMTRGLFSGGIAISGAASASWSLQENALQAAVMMADAFNCTPIETTTQIVDCLREKDPHALDFWGFIGSIVTGESIPGFQPVVDNEIVPLPPAEAFQLGYGRHVNFMTGSAYHDAAGFVIVNPIALPALGDKLNTAATEESMMNMLNAMLGDATNKDELIGLIMQQYPGMNTTDNTTRTIAVTDMSTDYSFASPSNWEAIQHATTSQGLVNTYQYIFRHRQSFLYGYPDWVYGSHLDDIYSVLGDPFMKFYRRLYLKADFDETDLDVSANVMSYYSNFAYTGNPNEGPFPVPVEWSTFNPSLQNYMLEAPTFSMESFSDDTLSKYAFWNDFHNHIKHPPPEPILAMLLVDDENVKPDGYFFKDLKNRYVLTEQDWERGVEIFRKRMHRLLGEDEEAWAIMEAYIDDMIIRRGA